MEEALISIKQSNQMECRRYYPSAELAQSIACYWTVDSSAPEAGATYRLIPDGYIDWVFHLGVPWSFSQSRDQQSKQQFQSHAFGHTPNYIDLELPPSTIHLFGIKFHPWAAHRIWRTSMHETTGIELDLQDLNLPELKQLETQIQNAKDTAQRIKICETYFRQQALIEASQETYHLIRPYLSSSPKVERNKISTRRKQQRFKTEVGISSKLFTRTLRLNRSLQLMTNAPKPCLTDIAYQCGYYDQSHFIRDVRHFTGLSPSQFLASIQPSGDLFNLRIS